jgi:hypothetical protein
MKKLLLLVGLVVLTTSINGYESQLPNCKIVNNNIISKNPCFGEKDNRPNSSYVGEFKNWKQHGFGTYKNLNSFKESYTGYWKNGTYHGQGTFIIPSGKYVGTFRYGSFHEGEFTDNTGWVIKGIWNKHLNIFFNGNLLATIDNNLIKLIDGSSKKLEINKINLIYHTESEILKIKQFLNLAPSSEETFNEILARLGDAKCVDGKCFCSGGTIYFVDQIFTNNVHDVCENKRYGNTQITLKEYLEYGRKIKLNKSSTATDNLEYIYCKRTDLDTRGLSFISAFHSSWKKCPEDSSSAQYIQVSLEAYNKSYKEHLTIALKQEKKRKEEGGWQPDINWSSSGSNSHFLLNNQDNNNNNNNNNSNNNQQQNRKYIDPGPKYKSGYQKWAEKWGPR